MAQRLVIEEADGEEGVTIPCPPVLARHHQDQGNFHNSSANDVDLENGREYNETDDNKEEDVVAQTAPRVGSFFYHSPIMYESTPLDQETFPLQGSVYSLIVIAPVFSWAFVVATYWILLKYTLFVLLLPDAINGTFKASDNGKLIITRFFLIPVTVGMQANLIHAISYIARTKYDPDITRIATNATHFKYNLSLALELIDGLLSMVVNFMVIMSTDQILNIFLDFASLHFLQAIDQVGYELIDKGFFGHTMELWCQMVNKIALPRRNNDKDKVIYRVTTILFFGTVVLIIVVYSIIVYIIYGPSATDCLGECSSNKTVSTNT